MLAKGPCKITGVEIGEAAIDGFSMIEAGILKAKYAYVIVDGTKVGFANRNTWSQATIKKVEELFESMERDIIRDIFDQPDIDSTPEQTDAKDVEPPSL